MVAFYQTRLHQFSECLTNFSPLIGNQLPILDLIVWFTCGLVATKLKLTQVGVNMADAFAMLPRCFHWLKCLLAASGMLFDCLFIASILKFCFWVAAETTTTPLPPSSLPLTPPASPIGDLMKFVFITDPPLMWKRSNKMQQTKKMKDKKNKKNSRRLVSFHPLICLEDVNWDETVTFQSSWRPFNPMPS